jgi:hypothetical protein
LKVKSKSISPAAGAEGKAVSHKGAKGRQKTTKEEINSSSCLLSFLGAFV